MTDLDKRFLTNTDETGRFIVKSLTTGKKYYIEPIGSGHPAGCISEKESLITPENGFKIIETLEAGVSPLSVIYQRDEEYAK